MSEALGRAFGLWWDGNLLAKLERLNWIPKMLKRYVDDLNTRTHQVINEAHIYTIFSRQKIGL